MSVESFETVTEQEGAAAQAGHLTFAEACLHDWQQVVDRVDKGRHVLEDVGKVIKGLERLESDYASKLRSLAGQLRVPATESSTVIAAVEALKNELHKRAHHSDEFAGAVRGDVVMMTVDNTAANHAQVFKQLKGDGNAISLALRDAESAHRQALKAVDESGKRAVLAAIEAQGADSAVSQHRTRLHLAALKAAVEAQNAEQRYQTSITHCNSVRAMHAKRLSALLQSLEDMDRKRIECLRDSLVKTYVYRTAQSRNNEYDTNHCIEVLHKIDPKEDQQEFLRPFKPPSKPEAIERLEWPEIEKEVTTTASDPPPMTNVTAVDRTSAALRNFLRQTPFENVVQTAQAQLRDLGGLAEHNFGPGEHSRSNSTHDRPVTLRDLVEKARSLADFDQTPYVVELEKGCGAILGAIWDADFVTARQLCGKRGLRSITEDLNHSLNRLVLCHALLTQTQQKGYELKNKDSLNAMALIFKEALDLSDAHNDFWTARFLMLLSQRLFARGVGLDDDPNWRFPDTEEQAVVMTPAAPSAAGESQAEETGNEPPAAKSPSIPPTESSIRRLHQGSLLYEHPLWNRVQFWEEAFLLTISEDLQRQMLMRAWSAVGEDGGEGRSMEDLEKMFKKRNPCWPALCVFAYSMTCYGIQEVQVKQMIATLCARYGLGQDYVNRLTECIKSGNSPPATIVHSDSAPAFIAAERKPQADAPN